MSLRRALVFFPAALLLMAGAAHAQNNEPPPLGAILDLNGQPIPYAAPQGYSVDFTAGVANTAITFAFRDDPAFISFSDASVINLTAGNGVNLLTNGDFSGGTYSDNGNSLTPIGWTYANVYGASFGGVVSAGCGVGGGDCWRDGAVGAYDAISQTIATTVGDNYQISFDVQESSGLADFSSLSTNGQTGTSGNGIDVLAYAQAGLPPANVPEPASLSLLAAGAVGAFLARRRRAA
ncbi:MAG: PEP-CTERM sorting domain-containing protein [Acidibrevibacterium sp.]|jgi:hypothetical protein|uniref:PEP-CTERM sorting domain-containing protein n=1 Tax=Acidibrevibacterium fodinaquatile TaxID=1969806 RepID=UPI000E0CE658|nr:PEP-CTERM sorting domain-containing protein [Acidibrevibacterium fodinaquatile]MCA7117926.1 PEP-CTERM sorting domain-containing protein [Acidibrevibacterium fodinaquatile]